MRVAVIDLGTNTFNLLIADCNEIDFDVIHSEKEGVAIGMGGINSNIISPESLNRALNTLVRLKAVCDSYNVESIRAIGTSAIRSASNGIEFKNLVLEKTGISIEIVSGLMEAELIYKGVSWSHNFEQPAVIMDIGGGSTEFIWADKNGMQTAMSLDIGISRMYQKFNLSDPLTQQDIFDLNCWLEEIVGNQLDGMEIDALIGASGTFETFYELHSNESYPNSCNVVYIDRSELDVVLQEIMGSTLDERDKNEFIIDIRKKMAPVAAVKTQWVLNKLKVKKIIISPYSLKEGALRG